MRRLWRLRGFLRPLPSYGKQKTYEKEFKKDAGQKFLPRAPTRTQRKSLTPAFSGAISTDCRFGGSGIWKGAIREV
jgi:hypothetical protein